MEGNVWEFGVGYLSGKVSVIPPEGGTLVPDEPAAPVQDRHCPRVRASVQCSCSKSIGLRKQLSHHKGTLSKED